MLQTYSVHDVYNGGFIYYQADDAVPTNNDQPMPVFESGVRTDIGVPATKAGRPLPKDAKPVGRGAIPIGRIARQFESATELLATVPGRDPSLGLGMDEIVQTKIGIALLGGLSMLGVLWIFSQAWKESR
jgi:hypothetical protein